MHFLFYLVWCLWSGLAYSYQWDGSKALVFYLSQDSVDKLTWDCPVAGEGQWENDGYHLKLESSLQEGARCALKNKDQVLEWVYVPYSQLIQVQQRGNFLWFQFSKEINVTEIANRLSIKSEQKKDWTFLSESEQKDLSESFYLSKLTKNNWKVMRVSSDDQVTVRWRNTVWKKSKSEFQTEFFKKTFHLKSDKKKNVKTKEHSRLEKKNDLNMSLKKGETWDVGSLFSEGQIDIFQFLGKKKSDPFAILNSRLKKFSDGEKNFDEIIDKIEFIESIQKGVFNSKKWILEKIEKKDLSLDKKQIVQFKDEGVYFFEWRLRKVKKYGVIHVSDLSLAVLSGPEEGVFWLNPVLDSKSVHTALFDCNLRKHLSLPVDKKGIGFFEFGVKYPEKCALSFKKNEKILVSYINNSFVYHVFSIKENHLDQRNFYSFQAEVLKNFEERSLFINLWFDKKKFSKIAGNLPNKVQLVHDQTKARYSFPIHWNLRFGHSAKKWNIPEKLLSGNYTVMLGELSLGTIFFPSPGSRHFLMYSTKEWRVKQLQSDKLNYFFTLLDRNYSPVKNASGIFHFRLSPLNQEIDSDSKISYFNGVEIIEKDIPFNSNEKGEVELVWADFPQVPYPWEMDIQVEYNSENSNEVIFEDTVTLYPGSVYPQVNLVSVPKKNKKMRIEPLKLEEFTSSALDILVYSVSKLDFKKKEICDGSIEKDGFYECDLGEEKFDLFEIHFIDSEERRSVFVGSLSYLKLNETNLKIQTVNAGNNSDFGLRNWIKKGKLWAVYVQTKISNLFLEEIKNPLTWSKEVQESDGPFFDVYFLSSPEEGRSFFGKNRIFVKNTESELSLQVQLKQKENALEMSLKAFDRSTGLPGASTQGQLVVRRKQQGEQRRLPFEFKHLIPYSWSFSSLYKDLFFIEGKRKNLSFSKVENSVFYVDSSIHFDSYGRAFVQVPLYFPTGSYEIDFLGYTSDQKFGRVRRSFDYEFKGFEKEVEYPESAFLSDPILFKINKDSNSKNEKTEFFSLGKKRPIEFDQNKNLISVNVTEGEEFNWKLLKNEKETVSGKVSLETPVYEWSLIQENEIKESSQIKYYFSDKIPVNEKIKDINRWLNERALGPERVFLNPDRVIEFIDANGRLSSELFSSDLQSFLFWEIAKEVSGLQSYGKSFFEDKENIEGIDDARFLKVKTYYLPRTWISPKKVKEWRKSHDWNRLLSLYQILFNTKIYPSASRLRKKIFKELFDLSQKEKTRKSWKETDRVEWLEVLSYIDEPGEKTKKEIKRNLSEWMVSSVKEFKNFFLMKKIIPLFSDYTSSSQSFYFLNKKEIDTLSSSDKTLSYLWKKTVSARPVHKVLSAGQYYSISGEKTKRDRWVILDLSDRIWKEKNRKGLNYLKTEKGRVIFFNPANHAFFMKYFSKKEEIKNPTFWYRTFGSFWEMKK
ncbi:MAG: hypothetical protein CL678_13135 [Bdellovibrionaceae bacterium]|nr:hypothetical protein [Pseudobdellovibrionaceae bacterium]